MYKDGVLTINYDTWKSGIGASPYVGNGDLRNVDIYTKPGVMRAGFKAVAEDDADLTDFILQMAYDEANDTVYAVDTNGSVLTRNAAGSWNVLSANQIGDPDRSGIVVWKDHVIVASNGGVDVYDIAGTSWSSGWQSFAEGSRGAVGLPHTMLHAQDDVLYITDGKYIASLTETAGDTFDPTDGASYTWNNQALDLPDGYVAQTMAEISDGILIGTRFAAILNRGNRADSFFWQPTSIDGTFTFQDTKFIRGNGVWQSVTQGNTVFQLVDNLSPRLYETNLSAYAKRHELRRAVESGQELLLYHDAIDIVDDQVLIGIGSNETNSNNLGIYGYKDRVMQLAHTVSAGSERVEIGSILAIKEGQFLVSWKTTSSNGVDLVSTTRQDGYAAVYETPYYTLGTALNPVQFTNLECELGKALSSDQGVRVKYRERLSDDFTTVATFDHTTYGAVSYMNAVPTFGDLSAVQLRVEITSASSSTETPDLVTIRAY